MNISIYVSYFLANDHVVVYLFVIFLSILSMDGIHLFLGLLILDIRIAKDTETITKFDQLITCNN